MQTNFKVAVCVGSKDSMMTMNLTVSVSTPSNAYFTGKLLSFLTEQYSGLDKISTSIAIN